MLDKSQLIDTIHGTTGVGGLELIDQLPNDGHMDTLKLVLQVIIGLMTLFNLYRNRNKKQQN